MKKRGSVAIYTSDPNRTSKYLGTIKEVQDLHFNICSADIVATFDYVEDVDDPREIYRQIRKAPGVSETKGSW